MFKRDPLGAILNAARTYAEQKLEEAEAGKLAKAPVFCAVLALEAAHAYLRLWGPNAAAPEGDELEPREIPEQIKMHKPSPVELTQGVDHYGTCEWGPN